jgi:hypothetical protein
MSSQGIVSGKKTSYHPGLSPVKGQKFGRITQARSCNLTNILTQLSIEEFNKTETNQNCNNVYGHL